MRRVYQAIAYTVAMIVGATLFFIIMKGSGLTFASNSEISSSDFVSIILSALGVMLTAVTVLLGALALIGWATFESKVKQSSEAFLEKRFSDNDPRYVALVQELKRDSLKGTRQNYKEENSSPFDEDEV